MGDHLLQQEIVVQLRYDVSLFIIELGHLQMEV